MPFKELVITLWGLIRSNVFKTYSYVQIPKENLRECSLSACLPHKIHLILINSKIYILVLDVERIKQEGNPFALR